MKKFLPILLLFMFCFLMSSISAWTNEKVVLSADSLSSKGNTVELNKSWKYSPGDNIEWARSEFDDSDWKQLEAGTFPHESWAGIGWFRLELEVDSSLWDISLEMLFAFYGAIEIYVDEKKLLQSGKVGASKSEEISYIAQSPIYDLRLWSKRMIADNKSLKNIPEETPFTAQTLIAICSITHSSLPISFPKPLRETNGKSRHIIAIRHSGFILESPHWSGVQPILSLRIGYTKPMQQNLTEVIRDVTFHQTFLISIFVAFALVHFLLFCFHPKFRANLYFALLTISAALAVHCLFQPTFTNNPADYILYMRLFSIAISLLALFFLLFIYSITTPRLPLVFIFFILIAIGLCTWNWFKPFIADKYIGLLSLATIPEIIRMFIVCSIKKRTELLKGSWIIGLGLLPILFVGIYQILIEMGVASSQLLEHGYIPLPFYAMLVIMISMSVFLARTFAQTNKDLEKRSNELLTLNIELEDRVKQRTTELAVSNQQLEKRHVEVNESHNRLQAAHTELKETYNELNRTQNQLLQSEKMAFLGKLVSGIAHELNSPIGVVNSAADVSTRCVNKIMSALENSNSLDDLKNNKQFQRSLKILEQNNLTTTTAGNRVSAIVKSLKNFVRLDEAELQSVDIHEGIESTLVLMQHEISQEIKVKKEFEKTPKVSCYPSEINQVFMTLLSNAIQAIENKGTIKIQTSTDNSSVYVKISDTGKGMLPEKLKTLFDFDFVTKESRIGMGMDMFNAYNIVNKHNGEIKVKSEVDKGTVFTIKIPVKP